MLRLQKILRGFLFLPVFFYGMHILPGQKLEERSEHAFEGVGDAVDMLLAPYDKPGMPGAAVAIMNKGEVVFQNTYGTGNLEYKVPVTPSTVFHVASVSKQFTVFSVLLLAESGRISLDDDIRDYISEVPDFGHTITLRHLIHHTSGLRDQWDLLIMAGWRLDDVITQEHILKMISWQKELNFLPGERYMYCNTGYTLLSEVVKRVTGMSLHDFTRNRIFAPLGMDNTFFCDDHERVISNRAYSYYRSKGHYKKGVLNYANTGATGLFTTLEDLTKWVRNFDNPLVGNKKIFEKMMRRGVLSDGDTIDYAMGQRIGIYHGMQIIHHTGSDAGFKAYLGRIPEKDFALIVLSNNAGFPESLIARKIIEVIFPRQPGPSLACFSDNRSVTGSDESLPVGHKKYCGTYWNDKNLYLVKIRLINDTLRFVWPGKFDRPMIPEGRDTFRMPGFYPHLRAVFDHHPHPGKTLTLKREGSDALCFISHLQVEYTRQSLHKYTGIYFSPELATWYLFEVKDKKLVVSHRRHRDFYIKPYGLDLFQADGRIFRKIRFVRTVDGQIRGCSISSRRAREIWFNKISR